MQYSWQDQRTTGSEDTLLDYADSLAALHQLGYVPDFEHVEHDRCQCGRPKPDERLPYCSADCNLYYEGPDEDDS